ncbi:redoxin family protein [Pedobacter sp. MC2016-14]|uniref:redoxin family protein n=1 Tax=Pedobacter sp. MC2016-14 TaxID=2897327 RepID=UPI001E39980C|nr:redoxin family protein [Pedobacter sp. MC2016-14]MCD0489405.1 redoxin family protein [Pedobacter sp. MC2016-14]
MIKNILMMICLVVAAQQLQAQVVEIQPEKPQRGDKITITYHTGAAGAKIGREASSVTLNFTFTRFFELPLKTLPLERRGNDWVTSFVLPRYAAFASFTFQSGDLVDQPSADRHYNLKVYNGNKREKSSYLYECYSLAFEMPKSPGLRPMQLGLLKKELELYPDNFEAKVFVPVVQMNAAKTPEEKQRFREEARRLIAARLDEIPASGANLNSVTASYFTIGENRSDSVYKVFAQRYPNSALARDRKISVIAKEKDEAKRISQLEDLLKAVGQKEEENFTQIHGILFKHYLKAGNAAKATYHARRSIGKKSPHTPEELKDIAALLTKNKLAPDTAVAYAEQSLKMADQWPVGLIRYFPEFGYILPYVPDSVRVLAVAEAKSGLLSIIALNKLYLKDKTAAIMYAGKSENAGESNEGLMNVAVIYEHTGNPKKAYEALWKVLLKDPSDTVVIRSAKINFLKFHPSVTDFNVKLKTLAELKTAQLKALLRKQLMNKPQPELKGITDLEGKVVSIEALKGKVIVMDFWATWCVPCMQELPYVQKVYDNYKNNPDVVFMITNSGARNSIDDARGWVKKNNQYTFPVYFNNDKDISEKVGFTVIPAVALLDKAGKLQFKTVGFEGAEIEAKLTQQIEILLNP